MFSNPWQVDPPGIEPGTYRTMSKSLYQCVTLSPWWCNWSKRDFLRALLLPNLWSNEMLTQLLCKIFFCRSDSCLFKSFFFLYFPFPFPLLFFWGGKQIFCRAFIIRSFLGDFWFPQLITAVLWIHILSGSVSVNILQIFAVSFAPSFLSFLFPQLITAVLWIHVLAAFDTGDAILLASIWN